MSGYFYVIFHIGSYRVIRASCNEKVIRDYFIQHCSNDVMLAWAGFNEDFFVLSGEEEGLFLRRLDV